MALSVDAVSVRFSRGLPPVGEGFLEAAGRMVHHTREDVGEVVPRSDATGAAGLDEREERGHAAGDQPDGSAPQGRRPTGWGFPARRGWKSGHTTTEIKKGWASLLKRAEVSDLHLHDLRRTLGSWMAMGGTSMAIIGRALGHRDLDATAIYARLAVDPVATAMGTAVDALSAAAASPPQGTEKR